MKEEPMRQAGVVCQREYRASEDVTLFVREAVFMAETSLSVDTFSPMRQFEVALVEMGYKGEELSAIAGCMKEEPMRQAGVVCQREYRASEDVTLFVLIDKILEEWGENGLIGARNENGSFAQ